MQPDDSIAQSYENRFIDLRFFLFKGKSHHWLRIYVTNLGPRTITKYSLKLHLYNSATKSDTNVIVTLVGPEPGVATLLNRKL